MANAIAPEVALAAKASMEAKIDAVMAKLDAMPPADRAARTVSREILNAPAVDDAPQQRRPLVDGDPDPTPPEPAAAPASAFVSVRAGERSDADVFARVSAFLDPTQNGPLFVSRPIRRRIFFGKYPSFAEALTFDHVAGPSPDPDQFIKTAWRNIGELGVTILGFLVENDPGIEHVLAHPGDFAKWPKLRRFSIANNRDPYLMDDLLELWKQYLTWKLDVTPTAEEMEKYSAQSS